MKERILILQRLLPHYRVGFFKKFCKRFPHAKVFYGQPYEGEPLKNAEESDTNIFDQSKNLYIGKNGKVFLSNIYLKIIKNRPEVIISVFNVGNLNIYLLFILKFVLRYKLILWSFGYDPVKGFDPKKRKADKLRLFLSQKADAVIFYWETGKQEVSNYSEITEHYFVAPNTLDTDRQFQLKREFDKIGRVEIKTVLGVKSDFHFVYVGRLLKDKQADLLLRAFKIVEDKNSHCSLSLIGDGPELNNLKKLSEELALKNVIFRGEILADETSGKWIYASDAFIMPGRLGLSVVHSFCFGTPVISQKKENYFHGEGVGYIEDGINSFLVEDGNIEGIAEKMVDIISDPALSNKLRINAFNTAMNKCSSDNMLKGFEEAIKYATSK